MPGEDLQRNVQSKPGSYDGPGGFDYQAGRVQDISVENLMFFVKYGGIDAKESVPRIAE